MDSTSVCKFCYFRILQKRDAGKDSQCPRKFRQKRRKKMNRRYKRLLLAILTTGAMLSMVSCKSGYYFPGSNGKPRRSARGCDCPTYVENKDVRGFTSPVFQLLPPVEGNESGLLVLNEGLAVE